MGDRPLIIGVTGTQYGVRGQQLRRAALLLRELGAREVHHGDCVGFDWQMDRCAAAYGIRRVAHPPSNAKKRAFCRSEVVLEPKPYLDRDQDIAIACGALIAAPAGPEKSHPRSGTWATVRRARRLKRWILIVDGDGHVTEENRP